MRSAASLPWAGDIWEGEPQAGGLWEMARREAERRWVPMSVEGRYPPALTESGQEGKSLFRGRMAVL